MRINGLRQWRILYREFLFRIVDREFLASHSKGDASQLLLQLLTLLIFLSVMFTVPALFANPGPHPQARLVFAWSAEHFLIATTMLTVGIFTVLSWGSMFPDQRDIAVLAPLPVRAYTILLAKTAGIATALAATVVALHAAAGLVWPLVMNTASGPYTIPALTSDAAIPPVGAADLQAVLDNDFAVALREGSLAPGAGGGVAIGAYTKGVRRVFAYGAATPDSMFDIASVTKVFTGLALAQMIEQGRVRADQPVRELIPDAGLVRPPNGGREITLLDLAMHYSGLPAMPADFRPRDPGNPYADFNVRRLYAFLRTRGVARPQDARFLYSNVGFGLLGHALATRGGVDYETLIRQLITEPLELRDTTAELTADQQRRLMQGYDREHYPVQLWDLDVLAGAGALKSTAGDMLTWLEANLHPERLPPGTLPAAVTASHARRAALGAGGIALAWTLAPTGDIAHAGDTSGFSAEVSFNPSEDSALVVLANTGIGTAVSADIVAEHVRGRLRGQAPIMIAEVTIPARGSVRTALLLLTAYWLTMLTCGIFVLSLTMGIQALAAVMLPRRHFLRVSSFLQVAWFCVMVATYFLQPMAVTPAVVMEAQRAGLLGSSPSYWFLGLFQTLSGSPALAPLARRAAIGVSAAAIATTVVCALSYVRTLRRITEEPDSRPGVGRLSRLPAFGDSLQTAVVQFSLRTLVRSAQHRVIFLFYLGIGFALTAVFLKSPAGQVQGSAVSGVWQERSLPLIVSSVIMMVCAVVGARLSFALPRELSANWIFRSLPVRGGARYVAARRRALMVVAVGPVWAIAAVVFPLTWPWVPAMEHLAALALLGLTLAELCLSGTQKIPFTCSYLPGQSQAHITAYVALVLLLPMTIVAARFEREALESRGQYGVLISVLATGWLVARLRTSWLINASAEPVFEDEPADRVVTLDLRDSRFASHEDRDPGSISRPGDESG
jgi:CubicO group peptidase (beta-lactamase class C family)